jgi:uncharacterized membrane protein YhaH (DUF805 family)
MNCPTCGNETESGAQFCGICGTDLASGKIAVGSEQPMVSFGESIGRGFSNYFNFSGRATRAENWWWVLFTIVSLMALTIVETVSGLPNVLSGIFRLATLIPSLAVGARRLHDINKSGWWLLLMFAILIGWIILIVWAIKQGDREPNKYGPDPRTTPHS